MQSLSAIFPNGYIAKLSGPTTLESDEGTVWRNFSRAAKTGAILAPAIGSVAGVAIGSAAHTTNTTTFGGQTMTTSSPKGLAIGSIAGLAAGSAVSIALLARSHDFYLDPGSPLEITLAQPLTLSKSQVAEAIKKTPVHPPTVVVRQPVYIPITNNGGTCYTPGNPGTPPTIIPGTPAIGDSPGTPPTVIPGTPPTPAIPHPCP